MSWRANLIDESKYLYPQPSTTITRVLHPKKRNTTKPKRKKTHGTPALHARVQKSNWSKTTMSGFPWSVRDKLEGKYKEPPPPPKETGPRHATYIFTYGLSQEDEKQIEIEEAPKVLPASQTQSMMNARLSKSNNGISGRLKEIKQSFHNAEKFPRANQPVPYFQDWGNPGNSDENNKKDDEAAEIFHSTRHILTQTGFQDGLDSYFSGLEEMDRVPEKDPLVLSPPELDEAIAAFQQLAPKPSRFDTQAYYDVGRDTEYFAKRSFSRNANSKLSKVKQIQDTLIDKRPKKMSRMDELDPAIFIKSPPIQNSHRDKLIQRQLQREDSVSPMTFDQYSTRKKQLLEAALKAYDRDIPTYEVLPDLRDETMQANEQQKAISRANIMDLLYHTLTNQSTSIQMKSPSTGLHLSKTDLGGRNDVLFPRPLQQFDGAVVSTVLRELQESRASGAASSAEFTPSIAPSRVSKHAPVGKGSKEKLKALRALENYELSKLRQHHSMAPKPVLTLLSVKNPSRTLSRFSGIGGGTTLRSGSYTPFASDIKGKGFIGSKLEGSTNTTTVSGRGSVAALSLQTRNEKYNRVNNVKHHSAPPHGSTVAVWNWRSKAKAPANSNANNRRYVKAK